MNTTGSANEYVSYNNREERARFIAGRFSEFLQGKILDVGCWEKDLQKYLPAETKYLGLDIGGKPDIKIDLEKEKLPFADGEFDCVVCSDVLEHLDNLHDVFNELIRVANKYVIISLPNNWLSVKNILLKNGGKFKFYGLPAQKPEDRHKWFFNFTEAENFIGANSVPLHYEILLSEAYIDPASGSLKAMIKKFFRLLLGRNRYNNIFATAYWAVLKK